MSDIKNSIDSYIDNLKKNDINIEQITNIINDSNPDINSINLDGIFTSLGTQVTICLFLLVLFSLIRIWFKHMYQPKVLHDQNSILHDQNSISDDSKNKGSRIAWIYDIITRSEESYKDNINIDAAMYIKVTNMSFIMCITSMISVIPLLWLHKYFSRSSDGLLRFSIYSMNGISNQYWFVIHIITMYIISFIFYYLMYKMCKYYMDVNSIKRVDVMDNNKIDTGFLIIRDLPNRIINNQSLIDYLDIPYIKSFISSTRKYAIIFYNDYIDAHKDLKLISLKGVIVSVFITRNVEDRIVLNLCIDKSVRSTRRKISYCIIAIITLTWSFLLTWITALMSLTSIQKFFPSLSDWIIKSKIFVIFLQSVLAPGIIILFNVLLPVVLKRLSIFSGLSTMNHVNKSVMKKFYYFQIYQLLYVVIISILFTGMKTYFETLAILKTTKLESLQDGRLQGNTSNIINNIVMSVLMTNILNGIVHNSIIYMTIIITTFTSQMLELLQLDIVFMYTIYKIKQFFINIKIKINKRTDDKIDKRTDDRINKRTDDRINNVCSEDDSLKDRLYLKSLYTFEYGMKYGNLLTSMTVILAFCIIAPLILPISIILMLIICFISRYKLFYVCHTETETKGTWWPHVFKLLIRSLFIFQTLTTLSIILICICNNYNYWFIVTPGVVILFITYVYHKTCKKMMYNLDTLKNNLKSNVTNIKNIIKVNKEETLDLYEYINTMNNNVNINMRDNNININMRDNNNNTSIDDNNVNDMESNMSWLGWMSYKLNGYNI